MTKLKLSEYSGDPLSDPTQEWSQLFQATNHAANIDDSVEMNHLETMVKEKKTKEAIAGPDTELRGQMYNVAFNLLGRNFGKPQMVVNAQRKRLSSFLPMKTNDGAASKNMCD